MEGMRFDTEEKEQTTEPIIENNTALEEKYVEPLIDIYLETYRGEPWFQDFERENIQAYIEKLRNKPDMHFEFGMDEDTKEMNWFYIYYIESGRKTKELFHEIYPDIVGLNIGDQDAPNREDIYKHMGELKETLDEEISDEGRYMYVIDAGISPKKQRALTAQRQLIKAISRSITKDKDVDKVFAQTLSEGSMISIMKRTMKARTIDEYPEGKEKKHITAVIDKDNFNNIRKRFTKK